MNQLALSEARELFKKQGAAGRRTQQSVDVYCNGATVFIEWCKEQGYTTVTDLDKRNVGGFNPWLSSQDRWAEPTKEHYTSGARQWLKFLEETGDLPQGIHERIKTHYVEPSERQSKNEISINRLDAIVTFMERQHPRHRDTIILKVLSSTGMRCCGLHSIDVGDVRFDDHGRPEIAVRNRPKQGTKLKKGDAHERNVPITRELFDSIKEYVEHHRHDVSDDYNRLPLITSRFGRLSKGQIRDICYKWTCGQHNSLNDCDCESKPSVNEASKCSKSEGTHAVRGAAITRFRNHGHTWDDISEMVAAEAQTLKLNYDKSGFEEKADRARSLLDAL